MIDFETGIFNEVATALETAHSGIFVTRESVSVPDSFPCASIRETANVTDKSSCDSSGSEKRANITYVVNVYSNLEVGAHEQVKSILSTVDSSMYSMKFNRTYTEHTEKKDRGIYRITARYQGQVDANGKMYRR